MSKAGTQQAKDLQAAFTDLARCIAKHPRATEFLDLLGSPLRSSDYDTNSRTGISDPTPVQAFSLDWVHTKQDRIADDIRLVKVVAARLLVELLEADPLDTASLAARFRCCGVGQRGFDEWKYIGPSGEECFRIVPEQSRTGLCDRCRQRRDEWQRKQAIGAA